MNKAVTADSMWAYENGVLKNKFDIKNSKELDEKENIIITNKLSTVKIVDFSLDSFVNLHKYLFEELYEFAGKLRNENVVLNGAMLCQHQVIELCLTDLMENFNKLEVNSMEEMISTLAYYYSELLVIYPFRDGNEITIKTFLNEFVRNKGYSFEFNNLDENDLTDAVTYAFYHDNTKLEELFLNNIKK